MNIKQLWSKRKFQHFVLTHVLFLIGILTVPFNQQYLYDLLIFLAFTLPISSVIQHLLLNHSYTEFRNSVAKTLAVGYLVLNSFWKFADSKSYHIAHHKQWLTDNDPTANEVRQGIIKYYIGDTNPVAIRPVETVEDPMITFVNRYFYLIKLVLVAGFIYTTSWTMFVHLVIVQQFLVYVASKAHDVIFHHVDGTSDYPWLFVIYSNDAWHIEHHKEYDEVIWHWKPFNLQYFYNILLFKK